MDITFFKKLYLNREFFTFISVKSFKKLAKKVIIDLTRIVFPLVPVSFFSFSCLRSSFL